MQQRLLQCFRHQDRRLLRKGSGSQGSDESWFDFRTGQGKSCGSSNSSVQLIKKLYTEPRSLFVVPRTASSSSFCASQKNDLHGRRCLAMTVSYETMGTRPAWYAFQRFRASSAQMRSISGSGLTSSSRIASTSCNFSLSGRFRISAAVCLWA